MSNHPCSVCSCPSYHEDTNRNLLGTCICGHRDFQHHPVIGGGGGSGGGQTQPDGSIKIPLGSTGYPGSGHKTNHCIRWCKKNGFTFVKYEPAPHGDKPPWGYCYYRK